MPPPLTLDRYQHIVVLTGAGISVASGLPTFRGPGGLWERPGASAVATAEMFSSEPEKVWSLFGGMRRLALEAKPNAAHTALAAMEAAAIARGAEFLVITQNVDRLHQRAGSKAVVEIHGSLFRTKCGNAACDLSVFDDLEAVPVVVLSCSRCGGAFRFDVVLFDEFILAKPEWDAKRALWECDFFFAVGTFGTVLSVSNFVRVVAYVGVRMVLVNL